MIPATSESQLQVPGQATLSVAVIGPAINSFPTLCGHLSTDNPCLIRSPFAIRPWQFVLEPLRGYLMLAERLAESPSRFRAAWNFGPAEADVKPVSWIADELAQSWGGTASWRHDTGRHPREANYLKLDVSKAKDELGWLPVLPLSEALNWIVEWYRTCHTEWRSTALDKSAN